MNEIMTRQAGEIGSSVGATLRGPVRNDTAARALANSRKLYDGLACLLAEVSTSYEDATITLQQGARLLTREIAKNISANIETSFEAVEALAGCTDLEPSSGGADRFCPASRHPTWRPAGGISRNRLLLGNGRAAGCQFCHFENAVDEPVQ